MRTFSAFASPNAEVSPERAILLSQVSLPQNELNREKRDVADAALANSAESAYQRLCSASRVFSRAFLLALIVNDPLSVARLHAQSSQPAIEFINVTAAAGIKFVHFKGNKVRIFRSARLIMTTTAGPISLWPTTVLRPIPITTSKTAG